MPHTNTPWIWPYAAPPASQPAPYGSPSSVGSGSGSLTTVEHGALWGARFLWQRWVGQLLLAVLLCYGLGRLLGLFLGGDGRRPARAASPQGRRTGAPTVASTLYDPERLQRTLNIFAEGPATASVARGERHRTEALCRTLLEAMLGVSLPKVRPKWLTNPTTRRALELDLYAADLRLAFEFDGSQHDVFTPHFHRSEEHFRYRQLLDRLKTELCREQGVRLLRIPWHEVSLSDEARTAQYLERLLAAEGIPFRSVLVPAGSPNAGRPSHA